MQSSAALKLQGIVRPGLCQFWRNIWNSKVTLFGRCHCASALLSSLYVEQTPCWIFPLVFPPLIHSLVASTNFVSAQLVPDHKPFVLLAAPMVLKVQAVNPSDFQRRFIQPYSQRRVLALVVCQVVLFRKVVSNWTRNNMTTGALRPVWIERFLIVELAPFPLATHFGARVNFAKYHRTFVVVCVQKRTFDCRHPNDAVVIGLENPTDSWHVLHNPSIGKVQFERKTYVGFGVN
mmetsp:Transcript_27290/g.75251  ORF Transcript_27290/g.75251 Transcript_27290/m.75251 type:complete len:234 (-) Transcript_27290:79-780(-)